MAKTAATPMPINSGFFDPAASLSCCAPETTAAAGRVGGPAGLGRGPGGGGGGGAPDAARTGVAMGTAGAGEGGAAVGAATPAGLGMLKIVLHCGHRIFRPNAFSSCAIR